ncbi:class I SAM-dependent methyltransferase [Nocardioides sp. B-3]|uniref:class I SAM-dependent methyltransferase n=1 Tax=Nocardioides sp. B-3 TaxID=2895565 RepID=UPI00215230FE|nr:class I SAM-dependent methyltransferase [Nocardioides sp. B-3]UUZ58756.1 methyltransferase domain-containing protein [Nocardioides sp. B-3]
MEIGDFTQTVATYDTVAADYAAHFPTTEPEDPLDLAMIDHFVARLGPAPSVLDAGCGTGRISRYLADRGCRVTGLDLSPGMVAVARRDHPDPAFAVGSIVDLPYGDASVDAALYWYSVIHSPDALLPRILTEAARVVRPGGHVLLAFPGRQRTTRSGQRLPSARLRRLDRPSPPIARAGERRPRGRRVRGRGRPRTRRCLEREGSAGIPPGSQFSAISHC